MGLVKTILFVVVALVTTGLLISAFILLFNAATGSSENTVKEKLLNKTIAITDASAKFIQMTNIDQELVPEQVNSSNCKQFSKKSDQVLSAKILK